MGYPTRERLPITCFVTFPASIEGMRQFVQLRSGVFSWINAFWAVDEEDGNARGD